MEDSGAGDIGLRALSRPTLPVLPEDSVNRVARESSNGESESTWPPGFGNAIISSLLPAGVSLPKAVSTESILTSYSLPMNSNGQWGLTGDDALKRLLETADAVLAEVQGILPSLQYAKEFLFLPSTLLALVAGILLVAHAAYAAAYGSIAEALILLCVIGLNGWLWVHERRLSAGELRDRAARLLADVREVGLNWKHDFKVTTSLPSVSVTRVFRDGRLRVAPVNLLVQGDVIQLAHGDKTPARVSVISSSPVPVIFEADTLVSPSTALPSKGSLIAVLLETPLQNQLRESIKNLRPKNLVENHVEILSKFHLKYITWGSLILSIPINILRYFLTGNQTTPFEIIVVLPIYALIPLLPITIPALLLAIRSFGNAELLNLFEQLQNSKTLYEDDDDVDEFDAAPPPTKDVQLDKWKLIKRCWKLFCGHDDALTRSCNLMENLSHTTTMCFIDREGTISEPFPRAEQMLFLNDQSEPVLLDVAEDKGAPNGVRFEDRDWQVFLPSLKPLGLNFLLNTDCGFLNRKRTDHHRKLFYLNFYTKSLPARQTCLCAFGREMGFVDEMVLAFQRLKPILTTSPYTIASATKEVKEVPSMVSHVLVHKESNSFQLFSDGHLPLVLDFCADFWTGKSLTVFNEAVEKKITDFYNSALTNDLQVVAYSYRPIQNMPAISLSSDVGYIELGSHDDVLSDRQSKRRFVSEIDSPLVPTGFFQEEKQLCGELVKGQTFLCAVTFGQQPKPNAVDFIEDLSLAGIRFVYLSPNPERESKAFCERLGLEIGWNSCVLLSSSNGEGNGYLETHDIKARLPRGIENIRSHIEDVDDIPLHVNLFAECSPAGTREMIKIFQEYGEVVCCVGSALNTANPLTFAMADISIAIEPFTNVKARTSRPTTSLSPFSFGAALNTLPTALVMHSDTSLYSLTQIIREARTSMTNAKQGLAFILGCHFALSFISIISYCALLPTIFQGYQILFLTCLILPILCMSFLFTPHDPNVMKTMSVKNLNHFSDRRRLGWYFVIRFAPVVIICEVVFVLCKNTILDVYPAKGLLFCQNVTLWVFVLYIGVISATLIHRTRTVIEFPPFKNLTWVCCSIFCLGLQSIFFFASTASSPIPLSSIPWYIFPITFVWLIPTVFIQEFVKMHDKKECTRFQKRSKLEFNTKLGMHSPI